MNDAELALLFPIPSTPPTSSSSTNKAAVGSYSIPEVYILSSRCEVITRKIYKPSMVCSNVIDSYASHILREPQAPPVITFGAVHVLHVRRNGVVLLTYSYENICPSFGLEFLHGVGNTLADFLGSLSEGALRRNQNVVYEILDEVCDFGVVQSLSAGYLKTYVHEEPILTKSSGKGINKIAGWQALGSLSTMVGVSGLSATTPGADRSIVSLDSSTPLQSEVYVDVFEKLSATFDALHGNLSHIQCVGALKVKSFLVGSPEVHLGLTHNLTLESDGIKAKRDFGIVCLHHHNFHKCVRTCDWDNFRLLKFIPPEGEVTVMNYTCVENVATPFKIFTFVEQLSPYIQDIVIKIRSEMPSEAKGTNVIVTCPCPADTINVTFEFGIKKQKQIPGQVAEYLEASKMFKWGIQEFSGTTAAEVVLFARTSRASPITPTTLKHGTGPVSLDFEIQQWSPSHMAVQSLKVDENSKYYAPKKWVRNVCFSDTYVSHHIQY
eukprot:PhF_6_TR36062/c0_g1_i2/m.52348/K12402/AP4M1; AP-4 complex subunit mu-1